MKRKNILFILASLITPISLTSHAQVTAGFTASDTAGCTPLLVQFTNTGSSGDDFEYMWYFGDHVHLDR